MDTLVNSLGAPLLLLATVFFGFTAFLWFLLPFSVFGIKSRLDEQIMILRSLENHVRQLRDALSDSQPRIVADTNERLNASENVDQDESGSDLGDNEATGSPLQSTSDTPGSPRRWQKPD